ncbi:MAG: Uma2 family endonuclease [Chloroflexi bacterium]|nr:MAG: Uma2 family endonuclease [Chloroflexota bacterium]
MRRLTQEKVLVTAEELWRMPTSGRRYELVRGELVEMTPVGPRHGRIAVRIARRLDEFVDAHGLGYTMVETGFRLEHQPDTVRAPDVSYLSKERMPPEDHEGYVSGAPDLDVEIISPGERDADVQSKVMDYLAHGTRLVWVVRPHQRTVTVYRADGTARLLRETDTLEGENVLPGFTLPLTDLFS